MIDVLILLFFVSLYPLGIFYMYYASDWRLAAKSYPRDDLNATKWISLFGFRLNKLLLRNSSKICFCDKYLIISGRGLGGLLAPQLQIPYADIKYDKTDYVVYSKKNDFKFNMQFDAGPSGELNKKLHKR